MKIKTTGERRFTPTLPAPELAKIAHCAGRGPTFKVFLGKTEVTYKRRKALVWA